VSKNVLAVPRRHRSQRDPLFYTASPLYTC
jgi:hypothetical protein